MSQRNERGLTTSPENRSQITEVEIANLRGNRSQRNERGLTTSPEHRS